MTVPKGWYLAGVWAFQSSKKKWEQIYHLENFYKIDGRVPSLTDASHIAEIHMKGGVKEPIAPAWWNGRYFTLIMWRDKHGKLRRSRRRDHIKAFIRPAQEGGSELEIRAV